MPEPIDQVSCALSGSMTDAGDGAINEIRGYIVDVTVTPGRDPAQAIQPMERAATRAIIEQAKGALMISYGIDDIEAFEVLRKHSQDRNIKLREVAAIITDHVANPHLAEIPAAARITHILRQPQRPGRTRRAPRPATARRACCSPVKNKRVTETRCHCTRSSGVGSASPRERRSPGDVVSRILLKDASEGGPIRRRPTPCLPRGQRRAHPDEVMPPHR